MIITRLLCPHVGCHAQAEVKAPHDDRAIESARANLRKHRLDVHKLSRSLVEGPKSQRWEYEIT